MDPLLCPRCSAEMEVVARTATTTLVPMPRMLRPTLALAVLATGLAWALPARASEFGTYRFQPGGTIEAVRTADVNGDGRLDLVLLASRREKGDGASRQELLVLKTPSTPVARTFYADTDVVRIPIDEGALQSAGAVAVGRFGPGGAVRLRFLGHNGLVDLTPDGHAVEPQAQLAVQTLLGRSPGRPLVFWDQVGDLDGDGQDEIWFPRGEGAGTLYVLSGRGQGSWTLDLDARSRGVTDDEHLLRRHAYVPNLEPADLDGDGQMELVAWRDGELVAWSFASEDEGGRMSPSFTVRLPFTKADLAPDEVYTPRLQLADVDGDGTTDLLVTLVTGNRRQLGSFRTRLLHFPGPFFDPETDTLTAPRVRIDTESVALHPRFVDLDGDGRLDYVSDSLRGTKLDMVKQVLGQDPTIWYVGFRFDPERGTYETVPFFSVERSYSREEAVSNRFGRTGFFEGDFDGDGWMDLLDLGNLEGLEILRGVRKKDGGVGDPLGFPDPLFRRVRVDTPLVPDAVVADLSGDARSDVVLWSGETLYFLIPGGTR